MLSLLTNSSALSALRSLTDTQGRIAATQAQLASGLRVGTAVDNAAYWSIGAAMKSQVSELAADQSALDLSRGLMDVTAGALASIITAIGAIKKDIITARQAGTDLTAVQADIDAQKQLIATATSSASFSGENLLTASPYAAAGTVEQYNTVDNHFTSRNETRIYTSGNSLGQSASVSSTVTTKADGSVASSSSGDTSLDPALTLTLPTGLEESGGGTFGFDLKQWYGADIVYDHTLQGSYSTFISSNTDTASQTTTSSSSTSYSDNATATPFLVPDFYASSTSGFALHSVQGAVRRYTAPDGRISYAGPYLSSDETSYASRLSPSPTADGQVVAATPILYSLTDIDLVNLRINDVDGTSQPYQLTDGDFDSLEHMVESSLQAVQARATQVGGAISLIDTMKAFDSTLSDAMQSGIGSLVDSDMNVVSTRLAALKVQEQLGIQALSVANGEPQAILKLFQ